MNNDFLDNKNFSYLINFVRNDVNQQTDFDIFKEKKYVNLFKKLIQTIHTSNMNKSNITKEYLNSVVIDKCVPFLVNQINNDLKKDNIFNLNTPKIETIGRPQATRTVRNKKKNVKSENDFSNLTLSDNDFGVNSAPQRGPFLDQSNNSTPIQNIAGKSTRDDEKIDVMKRIKELEHERNYQQNLNDSNNFSNQVQKANISQQQEINNINKQNIKNDNEFFRKLYQNDLNGNLSDNSNNPNNSNNNPSTSLEELMSQRSMLNSNSNQQPQQMKPQQMIPNNQSYFTNEDSELDSLYQNKSMTMAKEELQKPLNQIDMNNYLGSREELMPSNVNENINMSINNSLNINSEDLHEKLQVNNLTEENKKEYQEKTYLSTGKVYERRKKRVISVDVSAFLDDVGEKREAITNYSDNYWNHFKVNFQEEFVVDKITDVFLESITINNPAQANYFNNLYLVIDIDEFNVKTITNNLFMKDKFVLPNENTATSGSNKIFKYHLKSNYIATINPQKLASLTFRISNENNESVGLSLVDSTGKVDNAAGYKAGVDKIAVDNGTKFTRFDTVYNSNKRLIGIITAIVGNNLSFNNLTHIPLTHEDKIFIVGTSIRTDIFSGDVSDEGDTTVKIDNGTDNTDSSAVTDFAVGDKVYLGNGCLLGKLSGVAAQELTFASGISLSIPNKIRMYKESSLPRVFASDNKNNRIIMEFMFISR